METEVENIRPNIRIQIVNTMSEPAEEKMDVDAEANEEGEISDKEDQTSENGHTSNNKISSGVNAIFTTGIDIFDKKEQEKLNERAKRFALKPDEIHSFTDQHLQELHESLGINHTNESEVKFETVHLLGLGEMKSEDVVEYFANYAPEGIEWIDQNSCNVVWLDNLSAARALHFKSRVVRGMPAREPKDIFPKEFLDDVEEPEQESGQSILVKNQNREIELQNDIGEVILPKTKSYPKDSIDISEVNIPIPPGYWRLGHSHPKTKSLLVRFGKVTDKLPFKSEKCSKYYKKLANANQRYVISDSKKKELRTIFERNKELNQSKNPWGSLAKNWDKDAKFREREPVMYNTNDTKDDDVQIVEVKNPKLLARLGAKRRLESDEEKPEEDKNNSKDKFPVERKRVKVPRMKMYADEEEENQKRRKILMKIRKQAEEIDKRNDGRDLRNMLGPGTKLFFNKDHNPQSSLDLGSRLKNRSNRMVFAVARDAFDYDDLEKRQLYADARRELVEKSILKHIESEQERSPLLSRSSLLSRSLLRSRAREERDMLPQERHTRHSDRERQSHSHRSSRRRTPERTLHSDRMHSHATRRRRSHTPDSRHEKPRSKVAVVVKTPQKPSVASTIWSKVKKFSESEESSSESDESESENSSSQGSSSSSSESGSESEESDDDASDSSSTSSKRRVAARNPDRPGFDKSRLSQKVDHRSPLKITTANEHFTQKRLREV